MTILAIYGLGVLLIFVLLGSCYVLGGDGLEILGLVIAAFTAVFWPLVLVICIWDGIKICLKKLSII